MLLLWPKFALSSAVWNIIIFSRSFWYNLFFRWNVKIQHCSHFPPPFFYTDNFSFRNDLFYKITFTTENHDDFIIGNMQARFHFRIEFELLDQIQVWTSFSSSSFCGEDVYRSWHHDTIQLGSLWKLNILTETV